MLMVELPRASIACLAVASQVDFSVGVCGDANFPTVDRNRVSLNLDKSRVIRSFWRLRIILNMDTESRGFVHVESERSSLNGQRASGSRNEEADVPLGTYNSIASDINVDLGTIACLNTSTEFRVNNQILPLDGASLICGQPNGAFPTC